MESFKNSELKFKNKNNRAPSKRWGHSAVNFQNAMYLFGGVLESKEKKPIEPIYKLNLSSYEFERICLQKGPQLRDSHSCIAFQDQLYIWGGCSNDQMRNDLYCFSGTAWSKIPQKGQVPSARQSQLTVGIRNRWVFLYGGCSGKSVYEDMYILDTRTAYWTQLTNISGTLPQRLDASICEINGNILIFGGRDSKTNYSNDLYRLKMEWSPYILQPKDTIVYIQKVEYSSRPPLQRSGHAAVTLKDRYMLIMCGQRNSNVQNQKKPNAELLNDFWVFDTFTKIWHMILPKQWVHFEPRTNFTAVAANNDVIIFGGIKETLNYTCRGDLTILQIPNEHSPELVVRLEQFFCRKCVPLPEITEETHPKQQLKAQYKGLVQNDINIRMIYQLSKAIRHPFEAITMILGNLPLDRKARINFVYQTEQKNPVIRILFQERHFSNEQINSWLYEGELGAVQRRPQYPCFRLARSFLIISKYNHELRVVFFTDDFFCECLVDLNQKRVPNSQISIFDIISKAIAGRLGLNQLQQAEQQIILLDLERNAMNPNSPELILTNQDIFCSYASRNGDRSKQVQHKLSRYLKEAFLVLPPELKISINYNEVDLRNCKNATLIECEEDIIKLNAKMIKNSCIYYTPERKESYIAIYSSNLLKGFYYGEFCDKYSGYVELDSAYTENMLGVMEQARRLISIVLKDHYREGGLKRGSLTTLQYLTFQQIKVTDKH